jgi:hypothetical protein
MLYSKKGSQARISMKKTIKIGADFKSENNLGGMDSRTHLEKNIGRGEVPVADAFRVHVAHTCAEVLQHAYKRFPALRKVLSPKKTP